MKQTKGKSDAEQLRRLRESQRFHNGIALQKLVNECRNKPRFR